MDQIEQIVTDIKSLKIQGATNVAYAVLDGLVEGVNHKMHMDELKALGTKLAYARPTEPLAQNALRFIFNEEGQTTEDIEQKIITYKILINETKKQITTYGMPLIKDRSTYLTHCHATTVTNVFLAAHLDNRNFAVVATETRPKMQGQLTVQELLDGGIKDVTMVIDTAAVSLLNDKTKHFDAVVIGADLLSRDGFVNKIGSLAIIDAARDNNVPVYCFSTLLKYDPRPYSPEIIEKRSPDEIWQNAPADLKIYAPAFDYIPYNNIVKIVTEIGIIDGQNARLEAQKLYPFIG